MSKRKYTRRMVDKISRRPRSRPDMAEEAVKVLACPPDWKTGCAFYRSGATFRVIDIATGMRFGVWPEGLSIEIAPPVAPKSRRRAAPVVMVLRGGALVGGGWRAFAKESGYGLDWEEVVE